MIFWIESCFSITDTGLFMVCPNYEISLLSLFLVDPGYEFGILC